MADERANRHLAAILAADVVGYSRLMEADETGTLAALRAHRKELIDQTVRAFERLGVTDIGVVRAKDRRYRPSAMCQIASVQTLARREAIPGVDVVVIDECHRALAASYLKALFMASGFFELADLLATHLANKSAVVSDRSVSSPED